MAYKGINLKASKLTQEKFDKFNQFLINVGDSFETDFQNPSAWRTACFMHKEKYNSGLKIKITDLGSKLLITRV